MWKSMTGECCFHHWVLSTLWHLASKNNSHSTFNADTAATNEEFCNMWFFVNSFDLNLLTQVNLIHCNYQRIEFRQPISAKALLDISQSRMVIVVTFSTATQTSQSVAVNAAENVTALTILNWDNLALIGSGNSIRLFTKS